MEKAKVFNGRPSSSPSPPYFPVDSPICSSGTDRLSRGDSSLCSNSQPLRMLLQDGRLLNLTGSAEKSLSRRDLMGKDKDVISFKVLGAVGFDGGDGIF